MWFFETTKHIFMSETKHQVSLVSLQLMSGFSQFSFYSNASAKQNADDDLNFMFSHFFGDIFCRWAARKSKHLIPEKMSFLFLYLTILLLFLKQNFLRLPEQQENWEGITLRPSVNPEVFFVQPDVTSDTESFPYTNFHLKHC